MSQIKLLKCIADKLCELVDNQNNPSVRRDIEVLCDVTDPQNPVPVFVRYEYLTDGTAEVISALNLDGTPYAGVITDLRACEADQQRFDTEEKDFCVNGADRVRIRIYDADTQNAAPLLEVWQDVLGANVAAPTVADTITLGACPVSVLYPYNYEACATLIADGSELTVRVFEVRDASGVVINRTIEDAAGNDITGTVNLAECEDCCCATFSGCLMRITGFDYLEHAGWTPGDGMDWTVNGVPVSIDVATLPGAANKSTWYQPLWDALPAGWSVTVLSDVAGSSNNKPRFEFSFDGEVCDPVTLDIVRLTGTTGDNISITINPDGSYTAHWQDSGGAGILSNNGITDCNDVVAGVDGVVTGQL